MTMASVPAGAFPPSPIHPPAPSLPQRLRAFLRLLWIEIRRSQGYWLLPLMVGVGLVLPISYSESGLVFWADINNRIVQSYLVIAPLAATLATWLAGRDRRRRLAGLATTVPGSGYRQDLLAWATASFWGVAGYALVSAWLGWQAVRDATWGGPAPLLLGTGLLAILFFAAIGVLAGRTVNNRFAPLLALVVTSFLTIGSDAFKVSEGTGMYRQPLKLLLPWGLVSDGYPDVFYGSPAPYEREMLVWLAGATVALLAVIALLRYRSLGAVVVLALSLTAAGVGAANLVRPSAPWVGHAGPASFAWSCRVSSGVEICVHPAWEGVLDGTTDAVTAMIAPLAGLDGVPVQWKQGYPNWSEPAGVGMLHQPEPWYVRPAVADAVFPWLGFDSSDQWGVFTRPASQLVILHWLAGETGEANGWAWPFGTPAEVTYTRATPVDGGWSAPHPDEAELAAFEPEFLAAVERFAALSPEAQRAWLEANWTALRAGAIPLDEMP